MGEDGVNWGIVQNLLTNITYFQVEPEISNKALEMEQ